MNENWKARAACASVDTAVFYPYGREGSPGHARDVARARDVCRWCPVLWDCLAAALDEGDDWAVRGGTTPAERRALRVELGHGVGARPAA